MRSLPACDPRTSGPPDEWLSRTQADVVFAFFGFNESFRGYDGLEKFKTELDKFIKVQSRRSTAEKRNTRLVFFSPIAQEKHR